MKRAVLTVEQLKGRAQGFYIDRNITMTKELSEEDLDEKIRRMFPDRNEFEKINSALGDKIFGEMTDVTRKEKAEKDKASEERLGQLEEYQEDRKAARNKNLKENKNKTDLKSF